MIRRIEVKTAPLGLVGLLIVLMSVLPGRADAWDRLDIPAELRRPGVRLVAVEFYADFCAPCKKAVPKWNALHRKYKDRGLRLIVISVGDAGTCSNPGWQPDKVVCDFDGGLQEAFGAGTLPQAFLYSWQGNLLVKHAHYGPVEKAVKEYFRASPRILVSDPEDQEGRAIRNAAAVRELVRTDLQKMAKFEMVPTDEELESLRVLRKKGYELNRNEADQCELGKDVSANSELKVKLVSWGGEQTLVLQLYSVENGCMLASSKARVGSSGLEGASFEAVDALLEQLVGKNRGTGDVPGLGEVSGGEAVGTYTPPSGEDVVVRIESTPPGAKVKLRGITLCPSTPCNAVEIPAGRQVFEFQKDRYRPETVAIEIKRGMKPVTAALQALFGWLTINSEPVGVPVTLDGRAAGVTPLRQLELDPGRHRVEVGDERYAVQWQEFDLKEGESKEYAFQLQARQGGLKVKARNEKGEPVEGRVFVDGVEAGTTGRAFVVTVGPHEVEVRSLQGDGKQSVVVQEGETLAWLINLKLSRPVIVDVDPEVDVEAEVDGETIAGKSGIEWVYSRPAGIYFARSETTVSQYKACLKAGKCTGFGPLKKSLCNFSYENRGSHPINCVEWVQANAFCKWVDGRLPTEEEWEAEASNGGSRVYPWGNDTPSCDYCVMKGNKAGCDHNGTWAVCSKRRGDSVSGLCDLAGNVLEWTSSWSNPNPMSWRTHVLCGGAMNFTSRHRFSCGRKADSSENYIWGFRCVRSPQ